MTVESLIVAVTILVITLPSAVTWTAKPPDPDTPTAKARMMDEDSEVRKSDPSVVRVEPMMAVEIVLAITLAPRPMPTAPPPVADTPKARASMLEVSLADSVTVPPASTIESTVTSSTTWPSPS